MVADRFGPQTGCRLGDPVLADVARGDLVEPALAEGGQQVDAEDHLLFAQSGGRIALHLLVRHEPWHELGQGWGLWFLGWLFLLAGTGPLARGCIEQLTFGAGRLPFGVAVSPHATLLTVLPRDVHRHEPARPHDTRATVLRLDRFDRQGLYSLRPGGWHDHERSRVGQWIRQVRPRRTAPGIFSSSRSS